MAVSLPKVAHVQFLMKIRCARAVIIMLAYSSRLMKFWLVESVDRLKIDDFKASYCLYDAVTSVLGIQPAIRSVRGYVPA